MSFGDMSLQKKRDILLVLITVCWTAGSGEAIVGWVCKDSFYYVQALSLLLTGTALLLARRKISQRALPSAD